VTDWSQLIGAYGAVENMAELLQGVANGDSKSLGSIMGHIEHQGTLYPLTTAVVPELIKILGGENRADKAEILDDLYRLTKKMDESVTFSWRSLRGLYAQNMMRLQFILAEGGEVYTSLLSHPETKVRRYAGVLVSMFCSPLQASAAIQQQYEIEENIITKASLLWFWAKVSADEEVHYGPKRQKLTEAKMSMLLNIVRTEAAPQIRLAAALGWVHQQRGVIFSRGEPWQPEVEEVLFSIILDYYNGGLKPGQNSFFSGESTPSTLIDEDIEEEFSPRSVRDYALSFDLKVAEKLLSSPRLTPLLAHHICRELLDKRFDRVSVSPSSSHIKVGTSGELEYSRWGRYTDLFISSTPDEIQYKVDITPPTPYAYSILEKIIENDTFWELPTNLFSFFYNLPDDREELGALVSASKS
jgi:hypothetical protein